MSPEHSDGLGDADLPPRTVTAGGTQFERLRRILLYSGTRLAPLASDDTGGTLGLVQTEEGRRSARLASSSATGDGTVGDDDETQARIVHNLREERKVVGRLRAELPPPVGLGDIDFSETGGSTLEGDGWGAYFNGPLVRSASTTATVNDGDGAIGGTTQGTVEGPPALTAVAEAMRGATGTDGPRMCVDHVRCGHTQALPMCVYPGCCCCGECAHTNGREHIEHCYAAQVTEAHVPGSAEAEQVLNDTTPADSPRPARTVS